jgi:hypothetical protein
MPSCTVVVQHNAARIHPKLQCKPDLVLVDDLGATACPVQSAHDTSHAVGLVRVADLH